MRVGEGGTGKVWHLNTMFEHYVEWNFCCRGPLKRPYIGEERGEMSVFNS